MKNKIMETMGRIIGFLIGLTGLLGLLGTMLLRAIIFVIKKIPDWYNFIITVVGFIKTYLEIFFSTSNRIQYLIKDLEKSAKEIDRNFQFEQKLNDIICTINFSGQAEKQEKEFTYQLNDTYKLIVLFTSKGYILTYTPLSELNISIIHEADTETNLSESRLLEILEKLKVAAPKWKRGLAESK